MLVHNYQSTVFISMGYFSSHKNPHFPSEAKRKSFIFWEWVLFVYINDFPIGKGIENVDNGLFLT